MHICGERIVEDSKLMKIPFWLNILCILVHLSLPCLSQVNLSSATINAGGGSFRNEAGIFEWSLAEMPFVITVKKAELLLTGGVLQPYKPVFTTAVDFPNGYIKVFPTITTDYITVYCNIPNQGNVSVTITSFLGKAITEYTIPVNKTVVQKKISVNNFEKGLYYLRVQFVNPPNQFYQSTFEFIKM